MRRGKLLCELPKILVTLITIIIIIIISQCTCQLPSAPLSSWSPGMQLSDSERTPSPHPAFRIPSLLPGPRQLVLAQGKASIFTPDILPITDHPDEVERALAVEVLTVRL